MPEPDFTKPDLGPQWQQPSPQSALLGSCEFLMMTIRGWFIDQMVFCLVADDMVSTRRREG